MNARCFCTTARVGLVGAAALLLCPGGLLGQTKPSSEDSEIKLGRVNAAENDKSVKLVTDATQLARLNRIGQEIALYANTSFVPAHWGDSKVKKFEYVFKIVADKDPNAYSLPGGYIYVNSGLLKYVHSDDELAGVLAHEISHAAHHHMMKLIHEQNKMQPYLPLALIAAAVAKASAQDLIALNYAGTLIETAKLNGYGVEAEKDADQTAVHYLLKTKYNPVGLLTFMERLARDEERGPFINYGIFRTHPPSAERAGALIAELTSLEVPIARRLTDPSLAAHVTAVTAEGIELGAVAVDTTMVARFAPQDGKTGLQRAATMAQLLDAVLDENPEQYEVRLNSGGTGVVVKGHQLANFTEEDAAAQGATPAFLAKQALLAIRTVFWHYQLNALPADLTTPH